jgi:hypothetical protein
MMNTVPTAFAVLLVPETMETADFADLNEWLDERRDQIDTMMAAHERLAEVFGAMAE